MRKTKNKTTSIDISSLLDIIFILLLFVMISLNFTKTFKYIPIDVPNSNSGKESLEIDFQISMNEKSELFFNGVRKDWLEIEKELKKNKTKSLKLHVSKKVNYGEFISLFDKIKLSGIQSIQLGTEN
jgi:biopolymer transport protein ExbD